MEISESGRWRIHDNVAHAVNEVLNGCADVGVDFFPEMRSTITQDEEGAEFPDSQSVCSQILRLRL